MPYAIVAYLKKGATRFYSLSEDLNKEEAIAAIIRWEDEEIGSYLPSDIWLLKLLEIDVIDWRKK